MGKLSEDTLKELSFLKKEQIVIVEAKDDLIEQVINMLDSDGYDYSKNLVVFPGKRPSHYLKKALAQKIKHSFIPPLVFSVDEFVTFLFNKISNAQSIESIEAVGIIYEICLKHDLLTPFFKKFDNFISFGFKLFNLLEELYIEGISVTQLKEVETLIDIPAKSQEKLRFLSVIYQDFYEELMKRGLATRSLRYRKVSDCDDLEKHLKFKNLIYAGFFALTASEKRIAEKLAKIENFYFVFQSLKPDTVDRAKINLYSCPDTHGEVKIAGRLIEKSTIDEKTVIVLPKSDTLFPLVRQGIPFLKDEDYNISMGYPLCRTPIYGFFMSLFEAVNSIENNQIYAPLYLRFILHPYTKNVLLKNSAELSRIIFHEIEDLFKSGEISPFIELNWLERELPLWIASRLNDFNLAVDDIRQHIELIHNNTIKKFLKLSSIEEFIKNCKEVLLFIYEKSTARFHPLFYPYVEAFISQFDKLLSSLIKNFQFEHMESYFNFFKNLMMVENVPFVGTPLKGLQVLGFLETRNIKFKKVIFLDLNEGVFPPLSEDYLMPYGVRKILGLPTYQEREKLLYYYFSLLINSAEEVHLCYIKNDKIERSRFIEKIIWEMEKTSRQKIDIPIKSISWSVNLASKRPQEVRKTEEIMNIINSLCLSPSAIDDYLDCGLKFYYSYILKLQKKKEISANLERSEIGTIVHESLKEYFECRIGKKLNPNDFTDDIGLIVDDIFSKKYGSKVTGKLYLIKLQILKRLSEVIAYYRGKAKSYNFKILAVEELVEDSFFSTPFKYKIDLVESIDESVNIVDFKISGNPDRYKINFEKLNLSDRQSWSKFIGSLQIPIYMLLYSKKYNCNVHALTGYYFLLGNSSIIDEKDRFNPFERTDKEECIKTISTVLETLLNEIKDKDYPFLPTSDFKKKCEVCDYQPICGIFIKPSKTS